MCTFVARSLSGCHLVLLATVVWLGYPQRRNHGETDCPNCQCEGFTGRFDRTTMTHAIWMMLLRTPRVRRMCIDLCCNLLGLARACLSGEEACNSLDSCKCMRCRTARANAQPMLFCSACICMNLANCMHTIFCRVQALRSTTMKIVMASCFDFRFQTVSLHERKLSCDPIT